MGGDRGASVENHVEVAAHIANSGDPIRKEEREDQVTAILSHTVEVDVGMHIPKTRDEILPFGIHHSSGLWDVPAGMQDADDAIPVDDHGGVGLYRAVCDVDQSGVCDRQCLRRGGGGEGNKQEQAL